MKGKSPQEDGEVDAEGPLAVVVEVAEVLLVEVDLQAVGLQEGVPLAGALLRVVDLVAEASLEAVVSVFESVIICIYPCNIRANINTTLFIHNLV